MTETLQCLKKHGQRLDLEIAKEMRVPLATVRQHLTALADAVKVTFARLAASRELRSLYDKWFVPLGLPMGAYLESIFQGLGMPAR